MLKKIAFASVGIIMVATPLVALADTSALAGLGDSISTCLTPASGTSQSDVQSACATLLQVLIALVAQLTQNNPIPSPDAGAFTVSVASTPASQTVTAGTVDMTVANIQFDATASSEDIRIASAVANYTDNMPADPNSCQMFDGATALNTGVNIINPGNSSSGPQTYTFLFDNRVTIPKGTVKTLSIKCNIPSTATSGSFSWGEQVGTSVCGTGVSTGKTICPTVVTNWGPTMSIASGGAGSLTVSTDGSSPLYQTVAGGTTGVTLGVFKFHSNGEGVILDKVGLTLTSGSPADLTRVTLWVNDASGNAQVGSAVFTGSNRSAIAVVDAGSFTGTGDKIITVKGDIAGIGISQSATAGDVIQVNADSAHTISHGLSSGATITASGSTNVAGVRIYKSFPTVALVPLSSTGLSDGKFIRFKISASTSGSIGIGVFGFTFSGFPASANLQADLYAYTDSAYSQPVSGFFAAGALGSTSIVGTGGFQRVTLTQPLEIPAGQTYYFELRDSGKGTSLTGVSSLTTTFGQDYGAQGLAPAAGFLTQFTWSPNDQTTSQLTDADWTDGYNVPGLGTSGISQTRTGSATTSSAPTCTLTASPITIQSGSATTLSWTSTNATSAQWIPDPSGKDNVPPTGTPSTSGSTSFTPPTVLVGSYNPSEFLKVTGAGGSATCSVSLSVVGPEQAAFDNTVFTQTSSTPTISGTASGVTSVTVVLNTGSYNGTAAFNVSAVQVVNGHWSVTVSPALATGAYFINVTDPSGNNLVNGGYLNVTATTPVITTPVASTPKTIFLTSGTTWTVPSDWNSAHNTIEAIGGGGGANGGSGFAYDAGGGGGYAKISNLSLPAGATVNYSVGLGGLPGYSSAAAAGNGGDTWFMTTATLLAKGGAGSGCAGGSCGTYYGGQASQEVGSVKYSGGNGGVAGSNGAGGYFGGGGGGAAGPSGNGGDGSSSMGGPGNGIFDSAHMAGHGGPGANVNGSGFPGQAYGGAGGGSGSGGAQGGKGGPGIIVITYTPATVSSSGANTNLANALSALESALQTLLAALK